VTTSSHVVLFHGPQARVNCRVYCSPQSTNTRSRITAPHRSSILRASLLQSSTVPRPGVQSARSTTRSAHFSLAETQTSHSHSENHSILLNLLRKYLYDASVYLLRPPGVFSTSPDYADLTSLRRPINYQHFRFLKPCFCLTSAVTSLPCMIMDLTEIPIRRDRRCRFACYTCAISSLIMMWTDSLEWRLVNRW
jgi:hypothetical protein